ncbi:uncharacterized protein LY79DRAFT_416376 [Colletotrichum navitas]|uniref:Uncharacterized protein n=1 Tax=Colletotrichum navitas TaxID=681940 RepID=A0AAD8PN17_9PEZI|nr:uncharacterized protein LY79DRAFT_416376 [Colletotrichum navitas]KAK1573189.1 hypothetical protein LY79DRAFT_416376 [Colletotrichum navitas]
MPCSSSIAPFILLSYRHRPHAPPQGSLSPSGSSQIRQVCNRTAWAYSHFGCRSGERRSTREKKEKWGSRPWNEIMRRNSRPREPITPARVRLPNHLSRGFIGYPPRQGPHDRCPSTLVVGIHPICIADDIEQVPKRQSEAELPRESLVARDSPTQQCSHRFALVADTLTQKRKSKTHVLPASVELGPRLSVCTCTAPCIAPRRT